MLTLILTPKAVGSSYGFMKSVRTETCEIPATLATLDIKSVTPESSRQALLKWLKEAPAFVNQWTPYSLRIMDDGK
jgi:hypothetical protein